jgi:hypothetical protein
MAPSDLQPYLRDVEDDLLLAYEDVAAQRDLLSIVLDANLAVISVEQTKVSVRQNATIEQLTILATIFLPLTFVTGFFGQNFEWLVGHINTLTAFLVYGLGGLAVPLVLLFWWLRYRKPQKEPEGMPVFDNGANNSPGSVGRRSAGSSTSPLARRPEHERRLQIRAPAAGACRAWIGTSNWSGTLCGVSPRGLIEAMARPAQQVGASWNVVAPLPSSGPCMPPSAQAPASPGSR